MPEPWIPNFTWCISLRPGIFIFVHTLSDLNPPEIYPLKKPPTRATRQSRITPGGTISVFEIRGLNSSMKICRMHCDLFTLSIVHNNQHHEM